MILLECGSLWQCRINTRHTHIANSPVVALRGTCTYHAFLQDLHADDNDLSSQWCHMRVIVSQITESPCVFSTASPSWNQKKTSKLRINVFREGNPRVTRLSESAFSGSYTINHCNYSESRVVKRERNIFSEVWNGWVVHFRWSLYMVTSLFCHTR